MIDKLKCKLQLEIYIFILHFKTTQRFTKDSKSRIMDKENKIICIIRDQFNIVTES